MSDSLKSLNRALVFLLVFVAVLAVARKSIAQDALPTKAIYAEALHRQAMDADWFRMYDDGRASSCCDKVADCKDIHGFEATDLGLYAAYADITFEELDKRGMLTSAHLAYVAGYLDQQSRLCPVAVSGWNWVTHEETGKRVRLRCSPDRPDDRCDYGMGQANLYFQRDRVRKVSGCRSKRSCIRAMMDPYISLAVAVDHLEAQERRCDTLRLRSGKHRREMLRHCRRFMRTWKPLTCRKRMEDRKCGKPELDTEDGPMYTPEQLECREKWTCGLSCKCLITEQCSGGVLSTNGHPTTLCSAIARHREIMVVLQTTPASVTSADPLEGILSSTTPPAPSASLIDPPLSKKPEISSPIL